MRKWISTFARGVIMKTGSRVFGETLSESGMIVVQAEGKLLAFKEPASLRN
ncbi:hypothetical protein [Bacillus sp. FJAT-26390]|uniref:hypothetical protein n=1 Tax=Bacillus sp. FJAT-26390 TaxID=1743142 RepID=UPI00159EDCA3|nr:hypothetical protein [Bacillus sp. FJAT-26390]